jgi:hypothetical protein
MIMHYMFTVIDCLNPLVHVVGLGIAIWAFRRSLKQGYLVVAVYFALAVFSLLAMPKINRIMAERRGPDISEDTERRMNETVQETLRKFWEDERNQPLVAKRNINFPLGPILLVLGLWLVARKEQVSEQKVQQVSSEAAPSAPPDEPAT